MKRNIKITLAAAMAAVMVAGSASAVFAGEYAVVKGDCLWKIAKKYDTTWQKLADDNKLENPRLIFPGQVLEVPGEEKAEVPVAEEKTEAPAPVETPAPVVEEKEEPVVEAAELTALGVKDIAMTGTALEPAFSPDVTEYTVNVQDDIYGVMVTPEAAEGAVITVDGEEVPSGQGKVVTLAQDYDHYAVDYSVETEIKVVKGESEKTYKITILRDNAADVYALFTEHTYEDAETGLTLPYELYVPSNYDASKKYPVVYVLHGAGQRNQSLDMLLKRYQSATIWAKDSEAGINECIVVSPQIVPAEGNGWTKFMIDYDREGFDSKNPEFTVDNPYEFQDWSVAGHNLLQEIKAEYSVDENRIYATGLSMGGFGTFAVAAEYPDEFAAIVPVCGGLDPEKAEALTGKVAVWLFHAKDDPAVNFPMFGQTTVDALEAAGVDYKATIFEPGEVFYPNAHFAWTPAYANKEMRTWLFEQSK